MDAITANTGHIILMAFLVCLSAFFSGTETAFFNLTRRQIKQLKNSSHRVNRLTASLVGRPRHLLSVLLFGNMGVNVLYFACSGILILRVKEQAGVTFAVAAGFMSFVLLLLCGEIIPKSFSFSKSLKVSLFAALPVYLLVKILRPLITVFQIFIITPAMRLLIGRIEKPQSMSTDEFRLLMNHISKSGYLSAIENRLVSEIAGLSTLKVRQCLCPRVDMLSCKLTEKRQIIIDTMRNANATRIAVYHDSIDNIVGFIYLRDVLTQPNSEIAKLVRETQYIPEQKTVESLLDYFRSTATDIAIVVDEYGQIAGSVSLEYVAEELFGPAEPGQFSPLIEQVGPLRYRLSGDLAIHEWAKSFGLDYTHTRYSTVGGLIMSLMGTIPKEGDAAKLRNLLFTVEHVHKNRIVSVILTLESLNND